MLIALLIIVSFGLDLTEAQLVPAEGSSAAHVCVCGCVCVCVHSKV